MSDNFQDNVSYTNASLVISGGEVIDGNMLSIGYPGGSSANTIAFSNGQNNIIQHLVVAPTGANQTMFIPNNTAGGNATLLSNINLSAGTTSSNISAFVFSNSNNVSFGLNGATVTATITVPAQTVQTVGLYAVSNTTGASSSTSVDARSISFQGAGIASVGYSNGSVVVSVPSGGGGITAINVSASGTSNNLTAITFSNANGLTFGMAGSTITASYTVPTQTVQTIGMYAVSNTTGAGSSTTLDARTISYQGVGAASVGFSNGSVVIKALPTAGGASPFPGAQKNFLKGIVPTLNAFGYIPCNNMAANQGGDVASGAFEPNDGTNEGGATGALNEIRYSYSIFQSPQSSAFGISFLAKVPVPSSGHTYECGLGGGASKQIIFLSDFSVDTTHLVFQFGDGTLQNFVSTWVIDGNYHVFSITYDGATTYTLYVDGVAKSTQSSIPTHCPNVPLWVYTYETGTSTTAELAQVEYGYVSAAALGDDTVSYVSAASGVGASAGTSSAIVTNLVFSNSNGISFGLNGSTLTATVAQSNQTIGMYALSNTTGASTSSTFDARTMSFVGGGYNSIGFSNGSIQIIDSGQNLTNYEPYPLVTSTTSYAPVIGSWYIEPFFLPGNLTGGHIRRLMSFSNGTGILDMSAGNASFVSNTTGSRSVNFVFNNSVALYSLDTGTNSTRLASVWSNVFSLGLAQSVSVSSGGATNMSATIGATMTYIRSINAAGAYTTGSTTTSATTSTAAASLATSVLSSALSSMKNILSGLIIMPVGFNTTIPAGNYWLAQAWSTASTTAGTSAQVLSFIGQLAQTTQTNLNIQYRMWPQTVTVTNAQIFPGQGVYSAVSASPPSTMNFTQIVSHGTAVRQYFNFVNSTVS